MVELRQNSSPARAKVRCAVYTRKSSEEGLEQEFNSLDAQREACEAYITSQKHEGWTVLAALYDDGAYSGGTMDRPALQRLLDDVRTGKIDVVVVYKIDRLTRSLADFAKIVEVFDAQGVSFVSVTQAFNTTTSMGRPARKPLAAIGAPIRRRAAFADDARGGEIIPQGAHRLEFEIAPKDVAHGRRFRFVDGEFAFLDVVAERGQSAHPHALFLGRGDLVADSLSRDLALELGEGQQHVERETVRRWASDEAAGDVVAIPRCLLDRVGRRHGFGTGVEDDAGQQAWFQGFVAFPPLHPVLFETALHSSPQIFIDDRCVFSRKRFALVDDLAPVDSVLQHEVKRLDALVIGRLRALLADPIEFLNAISNGERDAPMQMRLRDAAAALSARWEHLPTETQNDFARSILVRAQVHADRIDLEIGSARLVSWLLNDSAGEGIVEGNRTWSANADGSEQILIRLSIRASLKRTGKEMKFIVGGVANSAPADTTLIRLLVRGQKIAKRMFEPNCPPLEAIAHEERIAASYATRLVRLAFLAPDIVAAILAGKQPPGLAANKLMADTRLPLDWRDQRAALGFA